MEPSAGSLDGSKPNSQHVLHLRGALDHSASSELREAIGRALSHGPATLVIDLASVSAVDAVGITVLVYACRAASAAHVKLVLSALQPIVRDLLEPTRLSTLCDVELASTKPAVMRGTAA